MAIKSVSIRIEEEMLKKLSYVADYEGRSVNSHVLVLIRAKQVKSVLPYTLYPIFLPEHFMNLMHFIVIHFSWR